MRSKDDFKKIYDEAIEGKSKEEALDYVETIIWNIEMSDRLTQEDWNALDVLYELKRKLV